ncbi:fatty acid synthase-like [Asbolus verrucosus]|uniref:Fatty acid synthase n=1 Tax=Asbolus verrucosus TaxID=1661398 RepID=A0A482W5Y4_ASBVE|nr:fatty acid synthase-like [Asbolus verrucosus]
MDEQVAITGISGRYPNCSNIEELKQCLLAGVDCVSGSHDRWPYEALGTSPRLGVVKDVEYFDAGYFGMNPRDANSKDPRVRLLLEAVFEAIVDAGLNPSELRGSNTGVYMGMSTNNISDIGRRAGILDCSFAIMANTISYFFDFKGPSFVLDTACSTGLFLLSQAVDAIRNDRCAMAVICAAQHIFDPAVNVEFSRYGAMDAEGMCKTFDLNRKGYVQSDAMVAIVLQKVAESKRVYATVEGTSVNVDGYSREGFGHPSCLMHKAMFENCYRRHHVDPLEVNYIEAHGTGTVIGDIVETQAVDEFFCKNRKDPLLIGSVKSNVGHSETASALVSISKIIIAIHEGIIPGNLHYKTPDPAIKGINEGRLKVIDKNTPLPEGLIAVSAFGFGGANATAILRPYTKRESEINNHSHRLVCVSGRTEEGILYTLKKIAEHRTNNDLLSLVDNIFSQPIENHDYRGYAVLSRDTMFETGKCLSKKRSVWFVYSGMGSQWPGMAKDLMRIEVFRSTMRKCAIALKPYGIDLENVVVNGTEEIFRNVVNTFTAITAVSVCLTDVLAIMGIEPEGVIGHSLGEVACAYADGLITAEQAVLIAYGRGYASSTSNLMPGLMAAVGLSVGDCERQLPEDVYVACDNCDDNVTISGPEATVKNFVQELSSKEVFNDVVNTGNIAYHCPHLAAAGPKFYEFIKGVLPEAKLRSKRWLPSAISEQQWNSELGRYNSAEYHHHNYMNRVQFRQLLKYVPKDAILIEVAPRGLLQAILKRGVDKSVILLPLLKPRVDNYEFLLSSIGKFFSAGGQPNLKKFYGQSKFPVSVDTPTISNLIRWDHSVKWNIPKYNSKVYFGERIEIDMADQSNEFLEGCCINGNIILPVAGCVVYVWKSFAKMLGQAQHQLSVVFENIKLLKTVILPKNDTTVLILNIFRSSGFFEIFIENDKTPFFTGKVSSVLETAEEFLNYSDLPEPNKFTLKMNNDDFYKLLHLRGYNYDGIFLGVQQCELDGTFATLKWSENWVTFVDSMVQFLLRTETKCLALPTAFEKIVIDPQEHLKQVDSDGEVELRYNKYLRSCKCGGIEIRTLRSTHAKRETCEREPVLKRYTFVPNTTYVENQGDLDSLTYALNVSSQIVTENCVDHLNTKIAEIESAKAIEVVKTVMDKVNLRKTTFHHVDPANEIFDDYYDLLITQDITKIEEELILLYSKCAKLIFAKIENYQESFFDLYEFEVIYKHRDLLNIDGKVGLDSDDERLGVEYSGVDNNRNNVMGLVQRGALATSVQPHSILTWTVPRRWSLEQAATVPWAYTISYYALFTRIQLSPNDSILVHNSTSDLSLAATILALNNGSTIYTVVSSTDEKEFLMEIFPSLQENNMIFIDGVNSFSEIVMKLTNQQGVDVIFNCKSDRSLKQSIKCASKNARFIEIDHDTSDKIMENNASYYKITTAELLEEKAEVLNNIASNIENYSTKGVIIPLSYTVFDKDHIEDALNKKRDEKNPDKCLIKIKNKGGFFKKANNKVLAYPRTYMDPSKCYIIIGGLGGFGLELANWLITRGATKLILNSRREVYSGYQASCLQKWKNLRITVLTDISDTTTLEGAESLLKYAVNLAPVGGIFNSALLLRDELITKQTVENFTATIAPKVFSAQNVDFLSRKLPTKLDYFVVFSSVAASLGNATQSNYGFANSALERLCESRKAEGLHALAVEWGPIADVGFVARLKARVKVMEAIPQGIYSCLDVLDGFLQQSEPVVFSCIFAGDEDVAVAKKTPIDSVAALFGIKDVDSIGDSKTLLNLGMDSILAFEIKHMLASEYAIDLSVDDIRNLTVEMVKNMGNA